MANSNKVFVSPGVYTSETDLTFVAQSVGVTTLGLVGETLQGPAFEPVLISDFTTFKTYFGGTSPIVDINGYPKYGLPYVAKAYLQESNQLFVTRILGLTGYMAGVTYGITALGGMTVDLTSYGTTTGTANPHTHAAMTGGTFYHELTGYTSVNGNSFAAYIEAHYSGITNADNGKWFTIGAIPSGHTPGGTQLVSPLTGRLVDNTTNGKEWYNILTNGVDEVYTYVFVYNSGDTSFHVTKYTFDAMVNQDYDGKVVCLLRSRGQYHRENLVYQVTGNEAVSITTPNNMTINPKAEFTISVTPDTGGTKTYTISLDNTDTKYVTKVLGVDPFDKEMGAYPLYTYEAYPNLISQLYSKGLIRGLNTNIVSQDEGTDFVGQYQHPVSPMVVSEVRGGVVTDLFSFIAVSDGDAGNYINKISIENINLNTGEFDVLIRSFNDSDDNVVAVETYKRCTMDPTAPGFIGKKIGTADGLYTLNSKYVMLVLADNFATDAIPAGFKGCYTKDNIGGLVYKTEYHQSGDVVSYLSDGTPVITNGDKVKRTSLGLSSSSQSGASYDNDMFKYKGASSLSGVTTFGFHLSSNASGIVDNSDNVLFKTTPYDLEGQSGTYNPLTATTYCKFTMPMFGGFDGWDIYRQTRTNTDQYIFGKPDYTSGNTLNGGVFSTTIPNSDYYSFLQGIQTFANPEAVNINVFATPGIDWSNNLSLVTQAIDMIENDRADSLYIIDSPNDTDVNSITSSFYDQGIDSNYSATYWPWIQILDADNATQLFIPPTGEVVKNIALTDNVAYPWFAVAGYTRGLVKSIKAAKKLTLDDRDNLYKNRINPIATFSDTGTIIWGNKTLQIRESALDRINVRRLLLRARKLISAVAVRLLFEQNDDTVRQEFLRLVNPILDAIKKERGLTDFRVTVSSDPSDIDNNLMVGKIFIKPTRSLEYIDLNFVITPTGASFENV
jgi:hypothetical protein